MTKTNLKEIEKIANEFNNDLALIKKEIKRIQSLKCNLAKAKGRIDYNEKMTEILARERVLIEARSLVAPKEKTVTTFEQADVDRLDFDQTEKALRSIQSKMSRTRWLTTVECDNDEYRNAARIEKMLQEHKKKVKPVDEAYIRKSELVKIIDTIEASGDLTQERIVELLRSIL